MANLPSGTNNRNNPYYLKPNHIKIAKEVQTKAEYLGSGPTNITLPTVAPALTNGEYVIGTNYTASGAAADPSGDGLVAIRYYWVVDGVQQAEGASYTPVSGDAGDSMYWRVEYEETGGTNPGLVVRTGGTANVAVPVTPVIASSSFDDSTDIWTVTTDTPSNGNWHWARYANGTTGITPDGAGGWSSTPQESGTIAVGASPSDLDIPETGTTGTVYEMFLYQRTVGGDDSNVLTVSYTADNTAPVLSGVTLTGGDTIAALDYSTDEGNGTAYRVLTTSATSPTNQQIIDGEDHTGSAAVASGSAVISTTGAQTQVNFTGLTNGITYHAHIFHRDLHRNDSAQATDSATPAVPSTRMFQQATEVISDAGTAASFTGISFTASAGSNRLLVGVGTIGALGASLPGTDIELFMGSQAFTLKRRTYGSGNPPCTFIFYLREANIPAGSQTISLDLKGATSEGCRVTILEYVDVDQTTWMGTEQAANASGRTASVTVTAVNDDGEMLMVSGWRGSTTVTELPMTVTPSGTKVDEGQASTNRAPSCVTSEEITATGDHTHTHQLFSDDSRQYGIIGVEINKV